MAIGKRLRFEILRRDNYQCRYCGAKPPQAALRIDHVVPEALGGTDDPDNLATACDPCNSGKASIAPDAPTVADVRQDALRWARAMQAAADTAVAQVERADAYVQEFYGDAALIDAASSRRPWTIQWPDDWEDSIRMFYRFGLPVQLVIDAYRRTDANQKVQYQPAWKYFCGICWSKLREIQAVASDVVLTIEDDV